MAQERQQNRETLIALSCMDLMSSIKTQKKVFKILKKWNFSVAILRHFSSKTDKYSKASIMDGFKVKRILKTLKHMQRYTTKWGRLGGREEGSVWRAHPELNRHSTGDDSYQVVPKFLYSMKPASVRYGVG